MGKFLNTRLWAGDLTPFEVLAGRAFDQLNCLNTVPGNLTKIFQKSQMPVGLPGGHGRF